MESKEIRFKYKNRGRKYIMPKGMGKAKSCKDDPEWEEISPGRYRKKGAGLVRTREDKAANKEEFMTRQVTKHELLVRDIDEGKL